MQLLALVHSGNVESLQRFGIANNRSSSRGCEAEHYDPKSDAIVRVEARRLRSKLDQYYRGEGKDDPVSITVPKGGGGEP